MKTYEQWEIDAYEFAKRIDACSTPAMKSWSLHFRQRVLWRIYREKWHEAKEAQKK